MMRKIWDTSPVDPGAFDPTPGPSPGPPPQNTILPQIAILTDLSVGSQLICPNGTWTGASTLRTPAERRVHRRFVSAHCVLAGHDAFGQGVLGEVGAQARHSVGEPAHVDADERALFCPGQVFLTAFHAAEMLTSASCLQASHVAVTARTPFLRMLARVIGGPGLERMACARLMEDEVQGDQEGALHGEDGDAGGDGAAPPRSDGIFMTAEY
jgi:hypothetical protein